MAFSGVADPQGGRPVAVFLDNPAARLCLRLTFSILDFSWAICISSLIATAILTCRKPATLSPPHCTLQTLYQN
jgi:hypothetical protein